MLVGNFWRREPRDRGEGRDGRLAAWLGLEYHCWYSISLQHAIKIRILESRNESVHELLVAVMSNA